ncbi:MAG: LON peptidase substrate-binding domain-containing protein [Myxococcales bacterium]|nr:LON peptidase substrate-binding domain-containing protein [Myxococcales bacterium]
MAERAVVFDKAAWHLDSVRAEDLPDRQAVVHMGLFFAWVVGRGLHASWLEERTPAAFAAFRAGEITGAALLEAWDAALLDDMFSDEGLAFAMEYLDPRSGSYLSDYVQQVAHGLPSEYHVPDTPQSAARVAALLEGRYEDWRATWDPSSGRPDLRLGLEEVEAGPLPERFTAPVIAVTSGVVLPGGPLGIRAGRPDSVRAVTTALAGERRVVLIAPERPGRLADPRPEDLLDMGVVAEIRSAVPSPDRPDARDVLLQCLARVEVRRWVDGDALVAEVATCPEPLAEDEDVALLEEVRHRAAEVVRRRVEVGHPPGGLALASAVRGEAMLDVVARDLPMGREELLTVLMAPDLATRARTILDALARS